MAHATYLEYTLPQLLKIAVRLTHDFVKLRDKDDPCISCGNFYGEMQAGHLFKAELYTTLKLDLLNIHKQCKYCNEGREGNFNGFFNGLKAKLTPKQFQRLIEKKEMDHQTDFKWDRIELINIIEQRKQQLTLAL